MGIAKLTQDNIAEIIKLAGEHINKSEIGRRFHIDHSTVFYHLQKHAPTTLIKVKIPQPKRCCDIYNTEYEAIPKAKSYADYIEAEQMRKQRRQETCCHKEYVVTVHCKCCGLVVVDQFQM